MSVSTILYPSTPVNVPESITQVSPSFKKEVTGVMGSIVLFFVVYLLLFILSIGLVVACVLGGIALIVAVPKLIVIAIGIGLIGLGLMVFFFLIKFLFAVSRFDNSNSIEITQDDQPRLFEFIRTLTRDVQTPFPKRIYLSPDVNAAVFYNSSFWSMFLPVRKNLQIGLGLVNALNVSEFKAVMAHEFGHFSQRSMKLGSFVYNVNKIIHNMLFENTSYAGFLGKWASMDGIFAFFAHITAKIAQSIQWILRQMYGIINKSYMSLSREMEFHADAVAARVSGSQSLVTALRRIELANTGYTIALEKCDDLFKQNKVSSNIYLNQKTVLRHLANEFKLHMENDMPVVSSEFMSDNNRTRVNFKDQWASHPSTDDRVEQLNNLGVQAAIISESAWALFDHPEELQSRLTQKVYEHLEKEGGVINVENKEFEEKFQSDLKKFSLPAEYNGFYDNRQIAIVKIEEIATLRDGATPTFEEIFSAENASLPKKLRAANDDIEILKAIQDKRIQTKTFDFDGTKYRRQDAPQVIAQIEEEQKRQQAQLEQIDNRAMLFFINTARQKAIYGLEHLQGQYKEYFEYRTKADEFLKDINNMLESLAPIFSGQSVPHEQINVMMDDLKADHEVKLKAWLTFWLKAGAFDGDPAEKSKIESFLGTRHSYFNGTSFIDRQLIMLNEVTHESWNCVTGFLFLKFKSILESQLLLRAAS